MKNLKNNKILQKAYFLLKQSNEYLNYYNNMGFKEINTSTLAILQKTKKHINKIGAITKTNKLNVKANNLKELLNNIKNCQLCNNQYEKLNCKIENPKAKIVFIDDYYHPDENIQNNKLQLLKDIAQKGLGIKEADYQLSYLLKCKPKNLLIEETNCQNCLKHLLNELEIIQPKIIISFGDYSARTLTAKARPIGLLRHETHYLENLKNTYLRVTFSLESILENPNIKKESWKDLQIIIPYLKNTINLQPNKN